MLNLPAHKLQPLDLLQRYTPEEAAAYLRCSRARIYDHMRTGALETITDGRRRYVPGWAIAQASGARPDDMAPMAAADGAA